MPIASISLVVRPTLETITSKINEWVIKAYSKHFIDPADYCVYINPNQLEDTPVIINTPIGEMNILAHSYVPLDTIVIIRKTLFPSNPRTYQGGIRV